MFPIYMCIVLSLLVISENSRSFVEPASLQGKQGATAENSADEVPKYMDDAVKELENLKNTVGSTLEMMKTHSELYTNVNGEEKGHSETKELLNEDGRLVASIGQDVDQVADEEGRPTGRVRTKVDIPSKGIHKTLVHRLPTDGEHVSSPPQKEGTEEKEEIMDNESRRAIYEAPLIQFDRNLDRVNNQYPGIQYSPLDMAEYVFWTGDEKGVTLAIEEFLQEGLLSREEAISFLQDIKYYIDYLQAHYNQMGASLKDKAKEKENTPNGLFYNKFKAPAPTKEEERDKKSAEDLLPLLTSVQKPRDVLLETTRDEEDYGELLDRLRVADFLYTEYSLEEVIYQLAKVMFTQSLTRGSIDAQQALRKFTDFLENEAKLGRISRALEKKVLDVLMAALTDTLNYHPELQQNVQDANQEQQNLLKQLLKFSQNKQNHGDAEFKSSKVHAPLNNALKHVTDFDVGKYKNP